MTPEVTCEEIRGLAPEVALDIATGEDRDVVLRHVPTCDECRHLLFELSSVGDGLLVALAPSREPEPGLDSRVLAAIGQQTVQETERRPQPRRWLRVALATGAVVVAAVLGAGSVYLATAADRGLGQSYRATLAVGNGSAFTAAPIKGATGRVGVVFAYQGDPSWVVVTFDPGSGVDGTYLVRIATRHGAYPTLGEAEFASGDDAWGVALPVDLSEVAEIQFLGPGGEVVFTGVIDEVATWS
jgi:hypothetical protein